jgi:hypothetical protein
MPLGAPHLGLLAAGAAVGAAATFGDRNDAALPAPDVAAARAIAERAIASIDWTAQTIAICVAGTGAAPRRSLVERLGAAAGVTVVELAYAASAAQITSSVATGMQALRAVLAEIERRDPTGKRYRVVLQGESQGAWVVGDVVAADGWLRTVGCGRSTAPHCSACQRSAGPIRGCSAIRVCGSTSIAATRSRGRSSVMRVVLLTPQPWRSIR